MLLARRRTKHFPVLVFHQPPLLLLLLSLLLSLLMPPVTLLPLLPLLLPPLLPLLFPPPCAAESTASGSSCQLQRRWQCYCRC